MLQFELWVRGLTRSGANVKELIEFVMDENEGLNMESCFDMQNSPYSSGKPSKYTERMRYEYTKNLTKWSKIAHDADKTPEMQKSQWGYFDDVVCFRH